MKKIAVLRVESVNYSIKPDEEKKAIIYAFQKFLNSLDFPIQILMTTGTLNLDEYLNSLEEKVQTDKLFEEIYEEYKGFMKKTVWENSILNKSFYIIIPETTEISIQIKICQDRLSSLHLRSYQLNTPELNKLLSNLFNSKDLYPESIKNNVDHLKIVKEIESEEEFTKRIEEEKKQNPKKFNKHKKEKDWEFHRVIYAYGYPRMVESGFLDKLVSCSGNFNLSLHIQPCSVETTLIMLNKELQKQRADLYSAKLKGQLNPSLEIKYADTHKILEELQKGNEKLFNISLYIDCKANTLADLNLLTRKIESELNALLIIPKYANFRMIQGFKSCMPTSEDKLGVKRNITTSALSAFFPFTSSFFKSDSSGIWLGLNKNNIPIIRDIFKLSNANGICLATSGSGKSYMAKLLISRYLLNGTKVMVIDPQGEYTGLVEKFNGQRIDLSRNSETMINPLDLMGHDYNEKRLTLMDLMPVMLGDVSEPQKAFLDVALTKAYECKGIYSENPKTWGKEPPIIGDVLEALKILEKKATSLEKTSLRSLINRMRMYVDGVFSFMNKKTNIDFDNRFVCFDIGNLPKQVKPAIMFLTLDYIYTKMKHSLERKLLVIDEAWSLLSRTEDAGYILEIVKTCRKFNLGLFLINQEVENMLDSQAGRSVLANTAYTLLLRQKPAMIKSVQNVFHLSEAEKIMLLTARPGEGLLLMEEDHSEIRIIASEKEHNIITTNADELLQLKKENPIQVKPVKNTLKLDQKVYLKKELSKEDIEFLVSKDFKRYTQQDLFGKRKTYLLKYCKTESAYHMIMIFEVERYLKKFTDKVNTYQSVKPDIVFTTNGVEYAIEVETGKVIRAGVKRIREKVNLLNKNYGQNWFFICLNKDYIKSYNKFGKTYEKRNIAHKIKTIFKKSNSHTL